MKLAEVVAGRARQQAAMIRAVGLRGAFAVNAITMVGVGPLITVPLVLATLHGSLALWAWLLGALIALCDGLVYAELGSLYPASGGTYAFVRNGFGDPRAGRMLAFLFAWQITLSIPLLLASGYIGFAQYAAYVLPMFNDARTQSLLAAAVGVLTLALLYRRIGAIATTGIALAGVALATLCAVIAAASTHFSLAQAASSDPAASGWSALAAGLGPALVITLYDYAGYSAACTLGDEVRDAAKTLPRSVVLSIVAIGGLYMLLQTGVLGVVSWHELVPATPAGPAPPSAQFVASIVVERTLGHVAAIAVTLAILVTAFASTFGNLLAASRIPYAAAVDGTFLRPFATLDAKGRFPNVALLTIGLLAIPACFFSLGQVISALTAGLVIVQNLAQIAALVAVRARGIRAPYRMWLYPLPAILAAVAWIYIFISSGMAAIAYGLGTLALGLLAYLVAGRTATRNGTAT